jgi:hypothetical protein
VRAAHRRGHGSREARLAAITAPGSCGRAVPGSRPRPHSPGGLPRSHPPLPRPARQRGGRVGRTTEHRGHRDGRPRLPGTPDRDETVAAGCPRTSLWSRCTPYPRTSRGQRAVAAHDRRDRDMRRTASVLPAVSRKCAAASGRVAGGRRSSRCDRHDTHLTAAAPAPTYCSQRSTTSGSIRKAPHGCRYRAHVVPATINPPRSNRAAHHGTRRTRGVPPTPITARPSWTGGQPESLRPRIRQQAPAAGRAPILLIMAVARGPERHHSQSRGTRQRRARGPRACREVGDGRPSNHVTR